MRRLGLLLMAIVLTLCTACSTQRDAVSTPEKAQQVVKNWLDSHPFSPAVYIDSGSTEVDDFGYAFYLTQSSKNIAKVRVVKSNGAIMATNNDGGFIAINDWYKTAKETNSYAVQGAGEVDWDGLYADDWSFELISRYPDDFKDAKLKFVGMAFQMISESATNVELPVGIGYDASAVDDVVIVCYNPSIVSGRMLPGDNIDVFGVFQGLETYRNGAGETIQVPVFKADMIIRR